MFADQGDVLEDVIDLVLERMTASEHLFHIEDDAAVDRVGRLWAATMDNTIADEDDITRLGMNLRFIQGKRQRSSYD